MFFLLLPAPLHARSLFLLSLICTLSTIAWNFTHCLQKIAEHSMKIKINGHMQNAQKETERLPMKRNSFACMRIKYIIQHIFLCLFFTCPGALIIIAMAMAMNLNVGWCIIWKLHILKWLFALFKFYSLALGVQTSLFMEMLMVNSILILYEFIFIVDLRQLIILAFCKAKF